MKIATNTFRKTTGKAAFKINWLGKRIYTEAYISWLIQNWNTAEEKVRVLNIQLQQEIIKNTVKNKKAFCMIT